MMTLLGGEVDQEDPHLSFEKMYISLYRLSQSSECYQILLGSTSVTFFELIPRTEADVIGATYVLPLANH